MKNLSVPLKYGIFIALALIAYFLILSLFGAHTNPYFSIVNGIIVAIGLYFAIKQVSKDRGDKFRYNEGFKTGIITGFTATVLFTAFFALYVELEAGFAEAILEMWRFEYAANVAMLVFTVALMGLATTVVLTLAFMQTFKRSMNTREGQKHTY